jgi:hypothetical protein
MRRVLIISLLVLLAGCATSRQSQMPSVRKYESNSDALQIYLRAYGDGYQRGCQMITTDYSLPIDMAYTNSDPFLQAAGIDGFGEGRRAAWKLVTEEMRNMAKRSEK